MAAVVAIEPDESTSGVEIGNVDRPSPDLRGHLSPSPTRTNGDQYSGCASFLALISDCQRLNVQAETFVGDPLDFDVDGIVSPANTIGEMSGGYDLVIRNRRGIMCERNVQASIRQRLIAVGEALAIPTASRKVPLIIVAPTMTAAGGKIVDPEIVFRATRAGVLAGHEAGVQRLGMVGMGAGYGGFDIYAAARALVEGIDEALDHIAGLTG